MSPLRVGSRTPWRHVIAGALTAGLFLAYLIALSPHLVHHAFDQGRPTCPHLAQSQQTPELQPDTPALIPWSPTESLPAPHTTVAFPSPGLADSNPRAPPRSAPSA